MDGNNGSQAWMGLTYLLPQLDISANSFLVAADGLCSSDHFSTASSSSSEAAWPSTERKSCSSTPGEVQAGGIRQESRTFS